MICPRTLESILYDSTFFFETAHLKPEKSGFICCQVSKCIKGVKVWMWIERPSLLRDNLLSWSCEDENCAKWWDLDFSENERGMWQESKTQHMSHISFSKNRCILFFFGPEPPKECRKTTQNIPPNQRISLFYCPKSENYEGFLEFIVFIWLLYLIVFKPEDSFVSTPDSLDRFVLGPLANVEVDLHHRRLHQFNLGGDIRRLQANIRRYIVTPLPVWKSGSSKTLSQSTFLTNKLIQI